jgi:hypothetical protein
MSKEWMNPSNLSTTMLSQQLPLVVEEEKVVVM